jgi:hypothetical protein
MSPEQGSSEISESLSLTDALGSMGLVSRFVQQKDTLFERLCCDLETERVAETCHYHFYLPKRAELRKTLTQSMDELPAQEKKPVSPLKPW